LDEGNVVLPAGHFFGAIDDRWSTGLVTLSIVRHAQPCRVPLHGHQHLFLSLLLRGAYREWVGGREWVFRPMTVVFHPEHLQHADEISEPDTALFAVEVSPALLGPREGRHAGLQSVQELGGGPVVWEMLRLLESLRRGERDPLACEEPISELLDALVGSPESTQGRPRWLSRVEELLQARYREQVSLLDLATLAGVHPVHVSRVFRRHHAGGSIRDFVHRLRVLHACRLIEDGESLASAAGESGFCDQSHMTRVFLGVTGMTPSRFRRTARG
jgi:AraC family transcriptional regulator